MKKFFALCLFVLAASGVTASQAYADNYSGYGDDCCCNQDWNGVYIGGNVGAFSHTAHRNDLDGFFTDNSGWTTIDTTVTAGVQLGYDYQCGNRLFGIVADWNWVDADRRLDDDPNGGILDSFQRHQLDWFTTIRGRAGLVVCDTLVYFTAGAVVTRFDTRFNNQNISTLADFHHHETRWGWTAGAGAEFMLGCNLSVGAEFLYLQFSHHERTFEVPLTTGPAFFTFGHSDSAFVGRLTVNYRFGDLFSSCCGY